MTQRLGSDSAAVQRRPRMMCAVSDDGSGADREQGMTLTRPYVVLGLSALALAACTPTVKVQVPDKPIEINLNVNMKIEQEVRVRLDREIEGAITQNPGIF
jgi:hypothetical protein